MKNKTIRELGEDYAKSMGGHSNPDITAFDFIQGFSASKKQTDKIILDTLNLYRSRLSDAERVKLTKIVNEEKVKLLNSQIEVLLKLKNKL